MNDMNKPKRRSNHKKNVHFTTVTLRYYPRTLGDNPCAVGGSPLGMSMKYQSESSPTPVEMFERRVDRKCPPGSRGKQVVNQLRMTLQERRQLLLNAQNKHSHRTRNWDKVEHEMKEIQQSRTQTIRELRYGLDNDDDDDEEDGQEYSDYDDDDDDGNDSSDNMDGMVC